MENDAMAIQGITGFRLRHEPQTHRAASAASVLPAALYNRTTQDRVMAKINAMGEGFYAMSENEFGDWLDALPQDEFFEFMSVIIELEERQRVAA